MKNKKKNKSKVKKSPKIEKTKKSTSDQESIEASDSAESQEFGSVTVLKAGTSLATLLIAQNSNGMTGPIY